MFMWPAAAIKVNALHQANSHNNMTEVIVGTLHRKGGVGPAQHGRLFDFGVLPVFTGGFHLFKLLFVGC